MLSNLIESFSHKKLIKSHKSKDEEISEAIK